MNSARLLIALSNCLLAAGLGLVYPPLALIALGAAGILYALFLLEVKS